MSTTNVCKAILDMKKNERLILLFELLDEGMISRENAIKKSGLTEEEFDRKRNELIVKKNIEKIMEMIEGGYSKEEILELYTEDEYNKARE